MPFLRLPVHGGNIHRNHSGGIQRRHCSRRTDRTYKPGNGPYVSGAILFAPIVSIVPAAATAPALIFVGILMLGNIRDVDFSDMSNALPAFCTIVFMPFTYSIANGVAFGLITYCLMKLTTGRRQDVKILTLAISVVFVVRYAFMTLG